MNIAVPAWSAAGACAHDVCSAPLGPSQMHCFQITITDKMGHVTCCHIIPDCIPRCTTTWYQGEILHAWLTHAPRKPHMAMGARTATSCMGPLLEESVLSNNIKCYAAYPTGSSRINHRLPTVGDAGVGPVPSATSLSIMLVSAARPRSSCTQTNTLAECKTRGLGVRGKGERGIGEG